jgi:predicted HTH transcriptional regulator
MSRPSPRRVFDDPHSAWSFLTHPKDDEFEGQHFDRKEAGRPVGSAPVSRSALDGVKELVVKTVSAFANSNVEGGLLVLGISSTGQVVGIDHLGEDQRNSITNLNTLLRTHAAEVKCHHCQDASGAAKTLCLIYSAYVPSAICETPESTPRAWVRHGHQSLPMSQEVRDQVRLRKGLLDLDSVPWCPYSPDDLDAEVVTEFRRVFHPEATGQFSDDRLLREAGAVVTNNGETWFTLPGLLFFASNPQRVLSHAYLRLLKFVVPSGQYQSRGTPSFDKDFRGPVTKQIRAARTFLRETSFFERLQHRKPDGGFAEEPELPTIAVDEAIVNAVAHRDYHTKNPVYCEHYSDAFIVKNPGRIRQQNFDLPNRFDLGTTPLASMPLNRKLLEWLRLMKDPEGNAFVQALSEGTKRMTREMVALRLPPPSVVLLENETILKLESKAEERKAVFLASIQAPKTAFVNAYLLTVQKATGRATSDEVHLRLGELTKAVRDSLTAHGWYIDRFSFSRIVAHRKGADLPISKAAQKVLRLFPSYCIQIHEMFGRAYLVLDYECRVLSILRLNEACRHLASSDMVGRGCVAQADAWRPGRIVATDSEWATIHFFDNEEEKRVQVNRVIPNLSLGQIEVVLRAERISFDLHGSIKKHSLASETGAARKRAEKIQATAEQLADEIFPVVYGEFEARMTKAAVALSEFERRSESTFHLERLSEPAVEFRDHHKLPDVREGITKYGSYDSDQHKIELVPICLTKQRQEMEALIERLKAGKFKYRGAERTFATRFAYSSVVTTESVEGVEKEVVRLLSEHPDWCGNESLNRLFLVHTPEAGYSTDDASSPYFVVKRRLLEAGVPCQMVDTGTLRNPDWKDLNLSLNIIAKCGVTPWVLPENIPDADFFVGLSYTQSRDGQKILGFANVFNSYGKWEFYAGNTTAFDARKRSENLAALSRSALERLKRDHSLPASPNLVFHHAVRISKDDYTAILSGVRSIAPDASVSFVWINDHNNFRLFDSRPESDGSLQRGSFVAISRRRVLLSTTGYNAYRKALGTPQPLEVSADHYRPGATTPVPCEARTLALQVLNLTKLNWASTDSFTAEPITTKYARNIAYLTAAFLRQREPFQLHQVLERTPWFV